MIKGKWSLKHKTELCRICTFIRRVICKVLAIAQSIKKGKSLKKLLVNDALKKR